MAHGLGFRRCLLRTCGVAVIASAVLAISARKLGRIRRCDPRVADLVRRPQRCLSARLRRSPGLVRPGTKPAAPPRHLTARPRRRRPCKRQVLGRPAGRGQRVRGDQPGRDGHGASRGSPTVTRDRSTTSRECLTSRRGRSRGWRSTGAASTHSGRAWEARRRCSWSRVTRISSPARWRWTRSRTWPAATSSYRRFAAIRPATGDTECPMAAFSSGRCGWRSAAPPTRCPAHTRREAR